MGQLHGTSKQYDLAHSKYKDTTTRPCRVSKFFRGLIKLGLHPAPEEETGPAGWGPSSGGREHKPCQGYNILKPRVPLAAGKERTLSAKPHLAPTSPPTNNLHALAVRLRAKLRECLP